MEMSKHYDSKHLLMMVGSGQNFEKAEFYLKEIEDIISHINSKYLMIRVVMSTLSHYDSAMSAHKGAFPVSYSDSMVTYTGDGRYYNTGLFTSRPNLKKYIRRASQVLHASSKMVTASLIEMIGISVKKPEFLIKATKLIGNLD
jgi:hypothetical protein